MKTAITQDDWASALVKAWLERARLSRALILAFDVQPGELIESHQWAAMKKACEHLVPRLTEFTCIQQSVMPFIARNCYYANHALWDGKVDKAKELMVKGGFVGKTRNDKDRDTSVRKMKRDAKSNVFTEQRSRSKSSDWKVVK